jgi:hypothetical protein
MTVLVRGFALAVAALLLQWTVPLAAAQGAAGAGGAASTDAREAFVRDLGGDRFAAGSMLRLADPVGGDLFAAGATTEIAAKVAGDALVVGGTVRSTGPVAQNLYVVGGQVAIGARVARNLRAAGGRVELTRDAVVALNASLAGSRVDVLGSIGGTLQVAGARVFIDAPIGGDVDIAAGDVELGPNARIAGRLRYASANELKRDAAAQVAGAIERRGARAGDDDDNGAVFGIGAFLWTVGIALLAVLLVLGLPGLMARAVATVRQSTTLSVVLGFAALASLPLLALVSAITIVGLPFALLVVLAYPLLLMLGYACGLVALADSLLAGVKPQRAMRFGWRVLAVLVAALMLMVLGWVPILGWLLGLLVSTAGLGALLRILWGLRGEG